MNGFQDRMQQRLQSNPEQAQKLKDFQTEARARFQGQLGDWKQKINNPERTKKFQEKITALKQKDPELAMKIQELTTLWEQNQDNPERARQIKEQLAELKKGVWKKLRRKKGMTIDAQRTFIGLL